MAVDIGFPIQLVNRCQEALMIQAIFIMGSNRDSMAALTHALRKPLAASSVGC
jgi:hypothetical protein